MTLTDLVGGEAYMFHTDNVMFTIGTKKNGV